MVKCLLSLALAMVVFGCATAPVRKLAVSPTVSVSPVGAIELSGDSPAPAKVDTKNTASRLDIPEGSRIEFNEKLGVLSIALSKATSVAVNRTESTVQGPVAFQPDRGPTVGEEAQAKADFWTMLGLRVGTALGIAVAIFGLVRGWDFVMYGGGAVAGACMFGLFIQKHPLLLMLIGLGVAAAVVGPIIYHTKVKKLE